MGNAGALCTLVMADFGADVIKAEPPRGDPVRFQPAWIDHTRPLLRELGYDDQQIEELGRRGIVQWADPANGGEA